MTDTVIRTRIETTTLNPVEALLSGWTSRKAVCDTTQREDSGSLSRLTIPVGNFPTMMGCMHYLTMFKLGWMKTTSSAQTQRTTIAETSTAEVMPDEGDN